MVLRLVTITIKGLVEILPQRARRAQRVTRLISADAASSAVLFLLCLAALLAACSPGGQLAVTTEATAAVVADTPAAEPRPTEEPTATAEPTDEPTAEPTEEVEPTRAPLPTKSVATAAAPTAALELDTTVFAHPGGYFSLTPPLGWTVESTDASASFAAPDDSGFIYVQVTHTGPALDGDSFERFVDNRDLNFFSTYDNYVEVDQQVNKETGVATVTKSLVFDGIPQTVFTLYDQYGPVIYSFDFWADEDLFDAYADAYQTILDTATVNSEAAAELTPYDWIYTFTGPSNFFTIDVPTPWRYEVSEAEFVVVDTFYSPDEHAVIQNITHDDGQPISRSEAGAFALELLRTYYAQDVTIIDDQVQPDGSERLTWRSASGDYSGISFFETRGTAFLLFTVMYDNPYEDVYFDTLDYTIGSYTIPEE